MKNPFKKPKTRTFKDLHDDRPVKTYPCGKIWCSVPPEQRPQECKQCKQRYCK